MKIDKKWDNYILVGLSLLSMTFLVYIGTTLGKKVRIDFYHAFLEECP